MKKTTDWNSLAVEILMLVAAISIFCAAAHFAAKLPVFRSESYQLFLEASEYSPRAAYWITEQANLGRISKSEEVLFLKKLIKNPSWEPWRDIETGDAK